MTPHGLVSIGLIACLTGIVASESAAQPIGTLRWQLQPYCNVLSLNVIQQGDVFILEGFDDQCAGTGRYTSVVGTGFVNPDGSIGVGLTTVMFPGGAPVHVDARIHVASLSGPGTTAPDMRVASSSRRRRASAASGDPASRTVLRQAASRANNSRRACWTISLHRSGLHSRAMDRSRFWVRLAPACLS